MAEPDNDLGILFPDRELGVGGRTVTVREFTFPEELKLSAHAKPLIDDLADFSLEQGEMDYEQALEVIGRHDEAFVKLVAVACDQPEEWVAGLNGKDGARLGTLFWEVNLSFFSQRLLAAIAKRRQAESQSPGAASTTS